MDASLADNAPESNRFQDESQNLCRDIFMARIALLVYSIFLVMIWKATLLPSCCEQSDDIGVAFTQQFSQL